MENSEEAKQIYYMTYGVKTIYMTQTTTKQPTQKKSKQTKKLHNC